MVESGGGKKRKGKKMHTGNDQYTYPVLIRIRVSSGLVPDKYQKKGGGT
jgi:hypothetical protein